MSSPIVKNKKTQQKKKRDMGDVLFRESLCLSWVVTFVRLENDAGKWRACFRCEKRENVTEHANVVFS